MKDNLNKLRKEYNCSISNIPPERLKEVLHNVYYDTLYDLLIKNDHKSFEKNFTTFKTIINEIEPEKRRMATLNALIGVPHLILIETTEQFNELVLEHSQMALNGFMMNVLETKMDLDQNNLLIELLENGKVEDAKNLLISLKDMVERELIKNPVYIEGIKETIKMLKTEVLKEKVENRELNEYFIIQAEELLKNINL